MAPSKGSRKSVRVIATIRDPRPDLPKNLPLFRERLQLMASCGSPEQKVHHRRLLALMDEQKEGE